MPPASPTSLDSPTLPLHPKPARPRTVAASVAVVAAVTWVLLAWQVMKGGAVVHWDDHIARWFYAHAGTGVIEFFFTLSALHTFPPVLLAASVLGAGLWRRGERVWSWLLPVAVLGVACLNMALKEWLQRARPSYSGLSTALHSFSFPSGHAAHATVFYGLLAMLAWQGLRERPPWRAVAAAAFVAMALAVMAGRVVLGVHYLADVVAGSLVGIAWLALLLAILTPEALTPLARRR